MNNPIQETLSIARTVAVIPNFSDKDAVKRWLLKVLGISILMDDRMVDFLKQSIDSSERFDSLYRLLLVALSINRALTAEEEAALAVRPLEAEAKAAGIDPLDVLAVVQAIAKLVKVIRE